MQTVLILLLLVVLLTAVAPVWPYSMNWGFRGTGPVGLLIIIIVVLALMGRI